MKKNGIIATIVIVLVLAGVVYLFAAHGGAGPSGTTTNNPSADTTPPVMQPGVPAVVTGPTITPSATTAVVNGTVNPNGAITTYWFEYGAMPQNNNRTAPQNLGSGYISRSAPGYITGLNSNTKYYFRLVAQNSFGTVLGEQIAFQTTLSNPPVGSAPTTQTIPASGVSQTTANLNGRVNPNGSNTSYWFEYGQTTSLGNVTAFQVAGSDSNSVNVAISISGLQPQMNYYFRLNTQNQFGTVNGAILSFTTPGPPLPGKPAATTTAASGIATSTTVLNGLVTPMGTSTDYWFEYSTNSLVDSVIGTTTSAQTIASGSGATTVSTQVTGLRANTKYNCRLIARNQYGTTIGNTVSFTTKK